jgi:hypothetical protein
LQFKRSFGIYHAFSKLAAKLQEENMATAKKSKKGAKRLRKGSKLEEQKPLTRMSTPTESVSLPFGKIEYKYTQQD